MLMMTPFKELLQLGFWSSGHNFSHCPHNMGPVPRKVNGWGWPLNGELCKILTTQQTSTWDLMPYSC